jgi:hypothetical protein
VKYEAGILRSAKRLEELALGLKEFNAITHNGAAASKP